MIVVTIINRQSALKIDRRRMRRAVRDILCDAGITEARIGVAVIDDPAIAKLHERFLNDPDPTDVLSFLLESSPEAIEGEVVVSADTTINYARRYRCAPEDELLRYVIHGTLHLVGYDDKTPTERAAMKKRERYYLNPSRE